MRSALILFWTVLLVGILSWLTWQKEQTVRNGRTVYLQLAPRDPRSIMQGDYMVLRYHLAAEAEQSGSLQAKGRVVLKLNDQGIATFARLDDGKTALAPEETFLVYRNRGGLRIGAESFFFQEGNAKLYENRSTTYGELKVDSAGNSVLIGLRDENLKRLGPEVVK